VRVLGIRVEAKAKVKVKAAVAMTEVVQARVAETEMAMAEMAQAGVAGAAVAKVAAGETSLRKGVPGKAGAVVAKADGGGTSLRKRLAGKAVRARAGVRRRSGCPVSVGLEIFGDRWSLLVVRDLMVRGYRTFGEIQADGDGIATNILAERLSRLEEAGVISEEAAPEDGRRSHYRLTSKGIALAPVMLELLIWGARHEETDAPCAAIEHLEQNRAAVLAETYRRWEERDATPLIPPFTALPGAGGVKSKRMRKKR
jgi:DNA-binding HxlR family transcriptional regulator